MRIRSVLGTVVKLPLGTSVSFNGVLCLSPGYSNSHPAFCWYAHWETPDNGWTTWGPCCPVEPWPLDWPVCPGCCRQLGSEPAYGNSASLPLNTYQYVDKNFKKNGQEKIMLARVLLRWYMICGPVEWSKGFSRRHGHSVDPDHTEQKRVMI